MIEFLQKLRWLLQRRRREDELQAELRFHLEEEADERQAGGLAAPDAARAARLHLGNLTAVQENTRAAWSWRLFDEFLQDVRYAYRNMNANRGFTALAVLSLALGIGANTAIYSFMESILQRSLPVADPESLVVLNWTSRPPRDGSKDWVHVMQSVSGTSWRGDKGAMVSGMFPYGAFETLRQENPGFSTLFGHFRGGNRNLSVHGHAAGAGTEFVTGEYFRGLAVSAAASRLIDSADDRRDATPVAVISFTTSQIRFGGPANAIGQPILVDNVPFSVIGVAPPEFFGVDPAAA